MVVYFSHVNRIAGIPADIMIKMIVNAECADSREYGTSPAALSECAKP